MTPEFDKWWHETGSGIGVTPGHDYEQHAKRIAKIAWDEAQVRELEIYRIFVIPALRTVWEDFKRCGYGINDDTESKQLRDMVKKAVQKCLTCNSTRNCTHTSTTGAGCCQ